MSNVNSQSFMKLSVSKLRNAGLSRPKISYLKGIATEEINGNLNYSNIAKMEDEEARIYLCQFKGIGKWTADCYLMAL